jgi:hypothetical protein
MEGIRIFSPAELFQIQKDTAAQDSITDFVMHDMQTSIEAMIKSIFGQVEMRWSESTFPFTHPSRECEIFFQNQWLEVLGCGKIQPEIMKTAGHEDKVGWAFGFGTPIFLVDMHSVISLKGVKVWNDWPWSCSTFQISACSGQMTEDSYPNFLKRRHLFNSSSLAIIPLATRI